MEKKWAENHYCPSIFADVPEPLSLRINLHYAFKVHSLGQFSSEIAILCTVLVSLSTCIPYQLNIFPEYAKNAISDEPSEIANFLRIV